MLISVIATSINPFLMLMWGLIAILCGIYVFVTAQDLLNGRTGLLRCGLFALIVICLVGSDPSSGPYSWLFQILAICLTIVFVGAWIVGTLNKLLGDPIDARKGTTDASDSDLTDRA